MIPHLGLQNDELFFSTPIFYPEASFYRVALGSIRVPVMVMSYSGALKTWLYAGLFRLFEPDPWSVRVPVLVMGTATVWLSWIWVRRIAGARAAIVASALLATNSMFLLTDVFDWGPVAIQHLLLMGGLVLVQRWIATRSPVPLALGFFLWGLGMWDKAILIWPLIGLGTAALLIYRKEAFRRVRALSAATALAAFVLGMLPLVVYNFERRGETATANAKLTTGEFGMKLSELHLTVNGSALFIYIVPKDSGPYPHTARTWIERAAVAISGIPGNHRANWMDGAWIAALLCLIFLWRTPSRRLLLFLLITVAVTWVQMALTKGAGMSAHHVVLLWPFPAAFLGVAFARVADRIPRFGRPAVAGGVALLILGNILTTNEYLKEFALKGGAGSWTDAIYPLSDSIDERTAGWIGLVDWGCLNGLATFHKGRLRLFVVNPDAGAAEIERLAGSPQFLFIQHTEDKQVTPGINGRFRRAAEKQGYVEHIERLVRDSNGRPVFEMFRLGRSGAPQRP